MGLEITPERFKNAVRQLLVFAKEPRPGAVKTRLASTLGVGAACELYRAFLFDTAAMLTHLDAVRVEWWVDGDPRGMESIVQRRWPVRKQPPGGLGDRLTFAFDAAYRRGTGPVAVIGTDCPLLRVEHLTALFERVEHEEGGAALIPAEDGGYVALGLQQPCPEAFSDIPWSTPNVLTATLRAFENVGRTVRLLGPLYDVDDCDALTRLGRDLAEAPERAQATAKALENLQVGPAPAFIRDGLGRAVALEPSPLRIVSLVPSMTQCLFDAGLGTRVVARTDYCNSPTEAALLPSVGGPKTVDVRSLLRLAPDLVLANAEENDRNQVEEIASRGVRVHVAFPKTLPDVALLLRELGALTHAEAPFGDFARALERATPRPPTLQIRCACLIWKHPYMTASGDTLTSALLEAAGGENVFAAAPEFLYPAVSLDAVAAAAPRVVLLPSEPFDFTEADAREVERSVPGATAVRIPGEWVTWYGSRMAAAIEQLREVLRRFQ